MHFFFPFWLLPEDSPRAVRRVTQATRVSYEPCSELSGYMVGGAILTLSPLYTVRSKNHLESLRVVVAFFPSITDTLNLQRDEGRRRQMEKTAF